MTQLTYYPDTAPAAPERASWEPAPDDVHTLRHGYNITDLDRLARAATRRVWGLTVDPATRYELAWSGIAEHLYAAAEPPAPVELIGAGQDAIGSHVRDNMRHHGIDRVYRGGDTMRGFVAYWEVTIRHTPSPERAVVERTALWQVWPHLTDRQRQALLALAAHGTYQVAADSLGITYKTFKQHIGSARARFLQLWHEHETPSRIWGSDRRVYRMGHAQSVTSYRKAARGIQRGRRPRQQQKAEIRHGTPSAYSNHRCRCVECVAAKSAESTARRRAAGAAPRRQITVSQFADAQRRHQAGESWTAIAEGLGFSPSYLRSIRRGAANPISDETARDRGLL